MPEACVPGLMDKAFLDLKYLKLWDHGFRVRI